MVWPKAQEIDVVLSLKLCGWITEIALWHGAGLACRREAKASRATRNSEVIEEVTNPLNVHTLFHQLLPPYRIIDLHDQVMYKATGDFTHIGVGGELRISWFFHWTLRICQPWTDNGLCSERTFFLINFEFVTSPVHCKPLGSWITNKENSTLRHVLFLPKRLTLNFFSLVPNYFCNSPWISLSLLYLLQETGIKQNTLVAIPHCYVKMYFSSCRLRAPELHQLFTGEDIALRDLDFPPAAWFEDTYLGLLLFHKML